MSPLTSLRDIYHWPKTFVIIREMIEVSIKLIYVIKIEETLRDVNTHYSKKHNT